MGTNQNIQVRLEAMATGFEMLRAVAKTVVIKGVKDCARHYTLCPSSLESISPGISLLRPNGIINRLRMIATESPIEHYFGFGEEIQAIDLRGAMVYARYSRLAAHRVRRIACS